MTLVKVLTNWALEQKIPETKCMETIQERGGFEKNCQKDYSINAAWNYL